MLTLAISFASHTDPTLLGMFLFVVGLIVAGTKPLLTGVTLTLAAATAGGDSFQNSGVEFVQVKNAHATVARNVTFAAPNPDNFGITNAAHNQVVAVPALTTKLIGPFPPGRFNDANGRVQITYDSEADLTIGILSTT